MGGCWFGPGLGKVVDPKHEARRDRLESLNMRGIPHLSARSFVMGYAHPEEVPLTAMVRSPKSRSKVNLTWQRALMGVEANASRRG